MLLTLKVRKLFVMLGVIGISCSLGMQNSFAAEEFTTTNVSKINIVTGKLQEPELLDMLIRIESLERQLIQINKQVGQSRTVANIAREAKELASDAWSIAVEARAIAVKTERKVGLAGKNKAK